MKNIKYRLDNIFRDYLIRKEKESHITIHYTTGSGHNNEHYEGVIYFYEWSDMNRTPITFFNLGAFEGFLRRSDIFLMPFQKDIIKNLERAYITCKKGKSEIMIRGTRPALLEALNNNGFSVDASVIKSPISNRTNNPPLALPARVGPPSIAYAPGDRRLSPMYSQESNNEFNYHGNPEDWY